MLTVATIIPTFNRKEYLKTILGQLTTQQLSNVRHEVVVVVDGSTDGTLEMLAMDFPQVHIVHGTGDWWYTRSMNEGFRKALLLKPDYLLCLNDDCEVRSDYVSTLLMHAESLGTPAVVGSVTASQCAPHTVLFAGVRTVRWLTYKLSMYTTTGKPYTPGAQPALMPSCMLPGRGMLIHRAVLDAVGEFENRLMQYGSDDEFCLRARKQGFGVWVCWPAVVNSHEQLTGEGSVYRMPSFGRYVRALFRSHTSASLRPCFFIASRYGIRPLLPITYLWLLAGSFYVFFKYRFRNG